MSASSVEAWLRTTTHEGDDGSAFLRGFVAQLTAAGLPIWRASLALMTMHPEVLWRTVQWQDAAITIRDQPHARAGDPFYTKSAVALARRDPAPVHVSLVDGDLPFPIAVDLRNQGATDYYVHGLHFANGQVSYVSYATKAAGGFSPRDVEMFAALRPHLAQRLELESSYYATRALLDVYLGKNASRRVLAGAFQRGHGEMIDAAIWFSDMRDFTALSDRIPAARLVETLDAYFDAVGNAVSARGGEVLKFIGDAVLAIFPLGDDPRAACQSALEAANEAFASLGQLNIERRSRGDDAISIGVALHRGAVMYGNIGARDRLDFTVISPAVNEASRLESLCKNLGSPLALSEAFAKTAAAEGVVDLGEHALKGVKAKLRVFTLARLLTPSGGT